jgi:hypothetical protein
MLSVAMCWGFGTGLAAAVVIITLGANSITTGDFLSNVVPQPGTKKVPEPATVLLLGTGLVEVGDVA